MSEIGELEMSLTDDVFDFGRQAPENEGAGLMVLSSSGSSVTVAASSCCWSKIGCMPSSTSVFAWWCRSAALFFGGPPRLSEKEKLNLNAKDIVASFFGSGGVCEAVALYVSETWVFVCVRSPEGRGVGAHSG